MDSGAALPEDGPVLEHSDGLDARRLDELFAIERRGVPGYVAGLMGTFLSDAPQRLRRMQAAHAGGEGPVLREEAHVLRAAAATVGAVAVAGLCAELEDASRAGRLLGIGARLDALAAQLERVAPVLARLIPGHTTR